MESDWSELFGPARGAQCVTIHMRVLRKQGRPLLALPACRRAAAMALSLYPAQTGRARAARALLRTLLRAGLAPGARQSALAIPPEDLFVEFLSSLAGSARPPVPELGILAGNPASPGRRFVLLVFDANHKPAGVVKAGASGPAQALIRKEQTFLEAASGKPGVPRLRGTFESERVQALALDYVAGDAPRPRHDAALPALLGPWVDVKRTVALPETPEWQRLEQAAPAGPFWPVLAGALRSRAVHPALAHGNLAPWNIKRSQQGQWTALDWERGELAGIPGWDWFHYVIQRAILAERLPIGRLAARVRQLLNSEPFRCYAARAGIARFELDLALAYLLYSAEVVKPAEGLSRTRELLGALNRET